MPHRFAAGPTAGRGVAGRGLRAFWLAMVGVVLLFIEGGAYLVEAVSSRLLQEPIRRRASILGEQSARIAALLQAPSDARLELHSLLCWR